MSNLLFVFERDIPTVSIIRDSFSHLKISNDIRSSFVYLSEIMPNDINLNDIIIFIRPNNIYMWKIAEYARKAGHIIITFCDDDLLNLPRTSPTIPWRKTGLIKTLNHSNVIWSTNRYITEKYRHLTLDNRAVLSDTIIQSEELTGIDIIHEDNKTIKIVYAAASSHAALFDEYIAPIMPALINEFGNTISFTFVGVHPEIENIQCEYISEMSLIEYRKYMKKNHFDIGLAPLHKDEFSKCKYYNKFIEYTTHGTVGVYSNTEPYTYVVQDSQNGFLADNTPAAWLNALRKAITDKQLRISCIENAIDYLKNNHSEKACIHRLKEEIPEITKNENSYNMCQEFRLQKMFYMLSRPLDWVYLTCFYFKNTGPKSVIRKIKIHFTNKKIHKN